MDNSAKPGQSWRIMKSYLILAMFGASALLTGCATGLGGHICKGPVGLQLYSVRKQMNENPSATLEEVRNWGFKDVELAGNYKMTPAEFKAALDSHGLTPISGHFAYDRWRDDPESAIQEAETFGCAWIPHQGAFDEVVARQAIAVFNKAGALAAQHHMTFFYHTHGYEFQPFGDGTLFDLLVKETNPDQVKFEMDIFWIAHAGQDPVHLLEKYPGRWALMHLKDMRKGTETGLLTGSSPVSNDVPFGQGQLDLPGIFRAAGQIGVKYYFIEDESDISEQQIPESLRYLRDAR
jgi:sugar phosphate isomerase/epimerase